MKLWMFNCEDVSLRVSQSMDRRLAIWERLGIRFHIMMCHLCARYRRQLLFLRRVLRNNEARVDAAEPSAVLPEAAKRKMKQKLIGIDSTAV